ncbi:PQQ-like beta-propeller repeat protein [Actinacidiphila bryophytorum]|uniref:PQQ-like beta-propeller repeat protein n=1 Tax=Actinacidiphila bryophytorum TaxID=1436133 RepID=UPI002176B00A|nr:PQQ-like beta-propeller repeat protein [Actinacidiphila bryophytorum]UWE08584.1 PQQ-like beta-propeller repeat protein [Actinacidiphila bryophytorum]
MPQSFPPPGPYHDPREADGTEPPFHARPVPPEQNPYARPVPPPAAARRTRGRAVLAAAVALLLAGVGVYALAKRAPGHRSGPAAAGGTGAGLATAGRPYRPDLGYLWNKPADPVAAEDGQYDTLGLWFVGRYAVKNEIGKVVAYDIDTGARAWSIPAPGRRDCSAARDSYAGLAAVQYGTSCEKVMVIDLAAGKVRWTVTLPGGTGGRLDFAFSEMAISRDTLAVDWLTGSAGYRLSDHRPLWHSGYDASCNTDGYAGGARLVSVVNCNARAYEVELLDPARNGAATWKWSAPGGTVVSAVVSTDPVIVMTGTQGVPYRDVIALDDTGHQRWRISLGSDKYHIDSDGNELQAVHNVLVGGDAVYLSLGRDSAGQDRSIAGIVAFGLADGKQRWSAKSDALHSITAIGFQDGKLLAYEPPDPLARGWLVTVDPATGAIRRYATLPVDSYRRLGQLVMRSYPLWHNGSLYIAARSVYATSGDQAYLVALG